VQIVGDATWLRHADATVARGDRYHAGWHADNGGSTGTWKAHRIWVMVGAGGGNADGGNADGGNAGGGNAGGGNAAGRRPGVCLVPTAAVDACDGPRWRLGAIAEPESVRRHLYERVACCLDGLRPGDAVFYREDVVHRTGYALDARGRPALGSVADRLGLIVTIDVAERPATADIVPPPEDWKCRAWAQAGQCETTSVYMSCFCTMACEKWRRHTTGSVDADLEAARRRGEL